MAQTCRQCSRSNPASAAYCYYDGNPLGTHVNGGPVRVGTQPFHSPFVFPDGLTCSSFDQLVLAHQDHWQVLLDLVREGYLQSFLSSMGRMDLALAAREASQAPDPERGLDELLTKLPNGVLESPKLRVEPTEINLGQIPAGRDHRFELYLENQGMRLLHGQITCVNAGWLSLGDNPGVPQKHFQFHGELTLPVHLRGKFLRASKRPLTARLVIESNGGNISIPVRVEVPIKPFPSGVLAGATTPRQIAEKARASPHEAAKLMESGTVAHWYEENGWTYPVPGPRASGIGAVQQFFEALGLVTPPRVDVSESAISLRGKPRARLEYILDVSCREARPVFAHATSDQPWLEVGRPKLEGRIAHIPLTVPTVPDHPGEVLRGRVVVTANGNQRFVVPVELEVGGGRPTARVVGGWGGGVNADPRLDRTYDAFDDPADFPEAVPPDWSVETPGKSQELAEKAVVLAPADAPPPRAAPPERKTSVRLHLLPLLLLGAAIAGLMLRDVITRPTPAAVAPVETSLLDAIPRLKVRFHDEPIHVRLGLAGMKSRDSDPDNGEPAIWEPSMRFGLIMTQESDPNARDRYKRLTYEEQGITNNTCMKVDGHEWLFGEQPFRSEDGESLGQPHGRWKDRGLALGSDADGRERQGRKSVWIYDEQQVQVTQTVEIVPGAQSRLLDTCLVRYRLDNLDSKPHQIGIRFLLDTYIGGNDGVPFLIPGTDRLCDTKREFSRPEEVPDFIQALEREDLKDPGTVVHLQFRVGGGLEAPERVTLGAWPNPRLEGIDSRCRQEKTLWDVPVLPIKSLSPPDSAVTMYWQGRPLAPGASREVGFAYGLGKVNSGEGGGKLAVTAGGSFNPGGEFTVTAYVHEPDASESVRLTLPEGFALLEGSETQSVPAVPAGANSRNSPVTWKVRAPQQEGSYSLRVQSSAGASQTQPVAIKAARIFD